MTVQEHLNNVSYEQLEKYVPTEETLHYINFIKMVNGDEGTENKTPAVHLVAIDSAFYNSAPAAIMCHRGWAKTSVFAEYLILYAAAFGKLPMKDFGNVNFIIYVGDSIENGVKSLRKNIEYRYNNSEFLKRVIPNVAIKYSDENGDDVEEHGGRKFTDVRMEFVNLRGDHLVVRMYGAKTGVRGAKELGVRPQVAIIDDIISDEDARSETIISSIEDTIHKAVKFALHPKQQKVIWLGTPFNAKDPLYKAVESGAYNVAVFPVCEKFPCTKEEFKGSWEDRFDYDYVQRAYNEAIALKKPQSFYQELMLQIISEEDKLIDMNMVKWFSRADLMKDKFKYNFYITTDLATSTKNHADFSVISVWAINNNGDYMLVDGSCSRRDVADFIADLFSMVHKYNPLGVGIEVTGQQGGFISWIQKEMLAKNTYFNLVSSNNNNIPGIRPTADKFSRFNLFLPRIKAGKMWFAEEMKGTAWMNECEDEFNKASNDGFKSKHDDVIDTISMLGSFEVYKPSYIDYNPNDITAPDYSSDLDNPGNSIF